MSNILTLAVGGGGNREEQQIQTININNRKSLKDPFLNMFKLLFIASLFSLVSIYFFGEEIFTIVFGNIACLYPLGPHMYKWAISNVIFTDWWWVCKGIISKVTR